VRFATAGEDLDLAGGDRRQVTRRFLSTMAGALMGNLVLIVEEGSCGLGNREVEF
jgi:hypothetical protein